MDRIHYAGDTFLTGTAIAEAVIEYAKHLARKGTSDSVDIPVHNPISGTSRMSILIGPASQLASGREVTEMDEIIDEKLLADLEERIALLTHAAAVPAPDPVPYDPRAVDEIDL